MAIQAGRDLEAEVLALRVSLRRRTWVFAVLVLIVACFARPWRTGASSPAPILRENNDDMLEVRRLVIKDSEDRERLILTGDGGEAGILLKDQTGEPRAELIVHDSGTPMLTFFANDLHDRLSIGVQSSGSQSPFFAVVDGDGQEHQLLGPDGRPTRP